MHVFESNNEEIGMFETRLSSFPVLHVFKLVYKFSVITSKLIGFCESLSIFRRLNWERACSDKNFRESLSQNHPNVFENFLTIKIYECHQRYIWRRSKNFIKNSSNRKCEGMRECHGKNQRTRITNRGRCWGNYRQFFSEALFIWTDMHLFGLFTSRHSSLGGFRMIRRQRRGKGFPNALASN